MLCPDCDEDISDLDIGEYCDCGRKVTKKLLLDGLSRDLCHQCDGSDPECPICGSAQDE